ncbi:hypothetical protein CTA2_5088 [Colletotrichum tanaceti]|uniref:Uncharacterized protein n=1 Tax=Colletotrichum tanaceti TaxID=1306861 RepID=A0A4U6X888_9PEZI|nr:hypothetical protein CTA2_5088 [Colletotrichum tanaceti]TKW51741.1 hypothetical protein CTA1_10601 [Colletotrichum tanaceti]
MTEPQASAGPRSPDASDDVPPKSLSSHPQASSPPDSPRTVIALIPDASSYSILAQLRPVLPRRLRTSTTPQRLADALRTLSAHLLELDDDDDDDGRRARGFAVVVFAVLANHVRRMILPALGVGGFGGPIAALKLAAGSPAVFLGQETTRAGGVFVVAVPLGRNAGWEGAWKVLGDAVGGYAVERVADGGRTKGKARRGQRRTDKDKDEDEDKDNDNDNDKEMVANTVVLLVWALGCAEYVHARAAHAAAVGIAHVKLLLGGPAHRRALRGILFPPSAAGRLAVFGSHLELACYVAYGLLPLLSLAAGLVFGRDPRRNPERDPGRRSRPGLALLMAGWAWATGYVARYSNKYYIGLEMSGLLLVGWWTLAATAMFGWRAVRARIGKDGPC